MAKAKQGAETRALPDRIRILKRGVLEYNGNTLTFHPNQIVEDPHQVRIIADAGTIDYQEV